MFSKNLILVIEDMNIVLQKSKEKEIYTKPNTSFFSSLLDECNLDNDIFSPWLLV